MPNIQICGFPSETADDLKGKIDATAQELNLGGDAITSIIEMKAEYCDGKRTLGPYLRICSTDATEITNIIKALKEAKIGIDIEWLVLNGFIPASEMT